MDEDGLPIVGTGIDYTKVDPLDQKRLLAFINHYVAHTVRFLNRFSGVCEEKMYAIESQLQRLETTMSILEGKLSSIPGVDDITIADTPPSAPAPSGTAPPVDGAAAPTPPTASVPPDNTTQAAADVVPQPPQPEAAVEENFIKVSQDPRYMKFFKMVNIGVPPPAVKLKMSAEGLNPDLLDTPDAAAPPGGEVNESSSDSEETFTDSD